VPATVQPNLRILVFCLCHLLHIFSGADIATQLVYPAMTRLDQELDQLVDETTNEAIQTRFRLPRADGTQVISFKLTW
jgi:hypothetical protein